MSLRVVTSEMLLLPNLRNELASAFPEREASPIFGQFGRDYFPHAIPDVGQDLSFVVMDNDGPLVCVDCNLRNNTLERFGFPVAIWLANCRKSEHVKKALNQTFLQIDHIFKKNSDISGRIREPCSVNPLGPVSKWALSRGWECDLKLNAEVHLCLSEADIYSSIRKSYKSLINWGRKNTELSWVNKECPDRQEFERVREFHRQVSGRETRAPASWEIQFQAIADGRGEVTVSRCNATKNILAANIVIYGCEVAYYFTGIYERANFDKGLAHWPLFSAIMRARAYGMKKFVLGDVTGSEINSKKERNIAFFKRGFATHVNFDIIWSEKNYG